MGVFKFLLCIVFIAGTAGYSACPSTISGPEIRAMIGKNGQCVAYSLSALEECLNDMVDDLNKAIYGLFGDTLSIVEKGFILRNSVNNSIVFARNTGIATFGDDCVFVQLSVFDGSTVPKGQHFCADEFGVHEYIFRRSDNPNDFTLTKWGKYKSFTKIDFPPKWGKWERTIQCHPCEIIQFGKELHTWEPYQQPR